MFSKILLLSISFNSVDLDFLDLFLLKRVIESKKLDWDPEQAKLKIYKFIALILISVTFHYSYFFYLLCFDKVFLFYFLLR